MTITLYVYARADAQDATGIEPPTGIDGGPVQTVVAGVVPHLPPKWTAVKRRRPPPYHFVGGGQ